VEVRPFVQLIAAHSLTINFIRGIPFQDVAKSGLKFGDEGA